jgi:hypothetical protein
VWHSKEGGRAAEFSLWAAACAKAAGVIMGPAAMTMCFDHADVEMRWDTQCSFVLYSR